MTKRIIRILMFALLVTAASAAPSVYQYCCGLPMCPGAPNCPVVGK